MTDDYINTKKIYYEYQYRLGKEYLVPLLKSWGFPFKNSLVLDIGCAEGGVLNAMVEEGARVVGFDIIPNRLGYARTFAQPFHLGKVRYVAADFFHSPLNISTFEPDLILLRDVVEHLPNKEEVFNKLLGLMRAQSRLLITFPPFYGPFGGHQQMLKSALRLVPYFHISPQFLWGLFKWWIRHFDKNPNFFEEMEKLRQHRTTIGGIKKLAQTHGLKVARTRYYLIRPSHKLRYGWPVLRSHFIKHVPVLRELFISGAFFLLEKN